MRSPDNGRNLQSPYTSPIVAIESQPVPKKQVIVRPNKQVAQIKKVGLVEFDRLNSRDCERISTATPSIASSTTHKKGPSLVAAKNRTMSRLSSGHSTPRQAFGTSAPRFRPQKKDPVPKFIEVKRKAVKPNTIKVNLSLPRDKNDIQAENENLKRDLESFGKVSQKIREENQNLREENEMLKMQLELGDKNFKTVVQLSTKETQTIKAKEVDLVITQDSATYTDIQQNESPTQTEVVVKDQVTETSSKKFSDQETLTNPSDQKDQTTETNVILRDQSCATFEKVTKEQEAFTEVEMSHQMTSPLPKRVREMETSPILINS